jgi:hypothetical protein
MDALYWVLIVAAFARLLDVISARIRRVLVLAFVMGMAIILLLTAILARLYYVNP